MKVLVRRLSNEKMYTWEDAERIQGRIHVNGAVLSETDIVSVMDDTGDSYVECSYCHSVIRNTPEEIEKHKNRYLDSRTCFNCRDAHAYNTSDAKHEYTLVRDSRYVKTTTQEVDLVCNYGAWYSGPHINTEEARNNCRWRRCLTASMDVIEDIFTKHPGIFDDIVTLDKVFEVGYKSTAQFNRYYYGYRLMGRNNIYAVVNDLNIVDHFVVEYHGNSYMLYYSKMKNELYVSIGGKYVVWNPADVNNNTIKYIKNKIAELYN